MQEIQLMMVKFIRILMVASLVPVIALLIIAGYSERVRRILLWILTPTAVVAVIAFLVLAPRRMNSVEDWSQGLLALKEALLAGLPFLLLLVVLGLGAFLFGPGLRGRAAEALRSHARSAYLAALLAWVEPELNEMVALEGRDLPEDLKVHTRITGGPGSGKSILLRRLLRKTIQQAAQQAALEEEAAPLPVWIDLDALLARPGGLQVERLASTSPVQTRFLGWLLEGEAQAGRLIFFVDSSVQTYGMTFAASGGAEGAADDRAAPNIGAAASLARFLQIYQPCPFVIAMPPGVQDGTLGHLMQRELELAPLSAEGIREGARALAGPGAEKLSAALLADQGVWRNLAVRPAFLHLLARFYQHKKRLPQDIRELFRAVVYPKKASAEAVEDCLARLAELNLASGRYWERLDSAEKSVPGGRNSPGGNDAQATLPQVTGALVEAGVLRAIAANGEDERAGRLLGFAHPIFLAYATALAWHGGHGGAFDIDPRSQQMDLDGAGPRQAGVLSGDPVLADALVFFNNLESDPTRLASMLAKLIPDDSGADAGSAARCFLAAHCLLALAPDRRPPALVERAAVQLIRRMAFEAPAGAQAAGQMWSLLGPIDAAQRLIIYAHAFDALEETRLEQTLKRMAATAPEDVLRAMLWQGDAGLCKRAGEVWAACEPREALGYFQDLYEDGPAERREPAITLLGRLPDEAAGPYLHKLLGTESDPTLRVAILKSLAGCGGMRTATLLGLLADTRECDPARTEAARQLAHATGAISADLRTSGNVRELVRISHLALPDAARAYLQRVLEALRGMIPETTTQWEEVVNPYVVGRPVTDPGLFFGRAALLRDLRIAVNNGNHVLLTGERRGGKTSLLYRLAVELVEEAARGVPVRGVIFDVLGLQPHEFFETAIRTIIEGLRDPALVADPNVPRPYTDQRFASDLDEVFAYLHNCLGAQSRLALLIDNGDALLAYPVSMHAALRRIVEGAAQQGLVVILGGTELARGWQQPEPPFYSAFQPMPLPRLAREEAARLVSEPVAGTFTYEAAAVEHILQAAQGRPEAIQAACQQLISRLLNSGERTVTAAMVVEALKEASPRTALLSQAESALGCLMDWLEAHPDAPNAQVEEQLKLAWSALQRAVMQQVPRARKSGRA